MSAGAARWSPSAWRAPGPLDELRDSRELLVNLTLREIRGKYKRTLLGHGWSLLNPLALILLYSIVFGQLLIIDAPQGSPSGVESFGLFLTCALLPWTFFANSLQSGLASLTGNSNLVQRVYFPRQVLVASTVLAWVVTFGIELVALSVVMAIAGANVLPWLPLLAVAIIVLTLFAFGLALLFSVANVYFRDTQHFIPIVLQVWFFLTPIVYPISYVRQAQDRLEADGWNIPVDFIYRLNPMERFSNVFRDLLYDTTWPSLTDSLYCLGSASAALVLGYVVFKRFEGRLAEEL